MATPRFKKLISEERIARAVQKLARQIDRHARAEGVADFTVVCVMDGAFIFCADLIRQMKTPTTIVFAKASSYDGTKKGITTLAKMAENIRGRPVLIVDTIFDTGKTVEKVLRVVRKQTSKIALAVLVEKHGKANLADHSAGARTFVGIKVNGDPFLIGYGLDCDGRFRHLRDISLY